MQPSRAIEILERQRTQIDALKHLPDFSNEFKKWQRDTEVADALSVVENICHRFHLIARQVRSRHGNRNTIEVKDEYDVQDLLHALLHLHFDDIRREEWTPSYAGGASRVDFLLKSEQVIIEVKKTHKGLTAAELGSQLLVDIARYKSHPDCKCMLCFVYDPEGRIGNPAGLETDLAKDEDGFIVRVIIGPKGV